MSGSKIHWKALIEIVSIRLDVDQEKAERLVSSFFGKGGLGTGMDGLKMIKLQGFGQFRLNRKGRLLQRRQKAAEANVHRNRMKKFMRKVRKKNKNGE